MKSSTAVSVIATSMVGFFLSGCEVGNDSVPGDCEHGLGKSAALLHEMQKGWTTDADAGIMLKTKAKLFDLCAEHVEIDEETSADIQISDASTIDSQAKSLALSVGAEASAGAFSAAVSASSSFASSSKFEMYRVDKTIIAQMYKVSLNTAKLYDLLPKENRDFLSSAKPADIVDRFGEFYATEAGFGGILRSIAMVEREEGQDESELSAEAEAHFAVGGIKVGANHKSASNHSAAKAHYHIKVYGGEPAPWLKVTKDSDIEVAQAAWADTFDVNKLSPMSMKVKPIWEFLEGHEDAQAKSLKAYLTDKWAKDNSTGAKPFGTEGSFVPKREPVVKNYTATTGDGCVAHEKWTDYSLHATKGNNAEDITKNSECFCRNKHGPAATVKSYTTSGANKDRTIACGEDSDEGCFWSCKCFTAISCQYMPDEPTLDESSDVVLV